MATVNIDTAVDAAAFSAFFEIFTRFQAGVNAQPAAWEKVAAAGGQARGTLEDAARSVRTLADSMDDILSRVRGLDDQTEKVSRRWTKLARGTREAAGHIKDATGSLLKWAGITGLVAGVAGFGAEHAIMGLGRSVSSNRSTAMGLGTTYGGLAAARIGYERYGDGTSLLSHIAEAQTDPSKRLPFSALGMGTKDYQGRDSADVMADVMRRAKDVLDKVPEDQLGNFGRASRLDEFFSLEEMRRLRHDSAGDVRRQADSIGENRRGLDLDPRVQRQWQEFTTQISRAGAEIETVLINRLVALEPGLEALSKSVTKVAETLLRKDGPVSQWIGELDVGLEWLAKHVDDPDFQRRVGDFVGQIGGLGEAAWNLGKKVLDVLHWLAKLTGSGDAGTAAAPGVEPLASGSAGDATAVRGAAPHQGGRRGFGGLQRPMPALGPAGMAGLRAAGKPPQRGGWWTDERMKHAYERLTKGGLSPLEAQGQIARSAYVEAGAGPTAQNASGHKGIMQWDAHRWAKVGGDKGFDAQLDAIIAERKGEESHAHRIGMAAKTDYDGAVSASAAERGEGYDPRSGRDLFTGKTMAAIPHVRDVVAPPPRPTTVTISKNPGGNPTQTAAMAAAPQ